MATSTWGLMRFNYFIATPSFLGINLPADACVALSPSFSSKGLKILWINTEESQQSEVWVSGWAYVVSAELQHPLELVLTWQSKQIKVSSLSYTGQSKTEGCKWCCLPRAHSDSINWGYFCCCKGMVWASCSAHALLNSVKRKGEQGKALGCLRRSTERPLRVWFEPNCI